ncbi:MAG: hypothetical protein KF871_07420 [Hydrogenophaga sp.]|uniref:DUF6891 domain-containing protein n=1 Tax=Hydrogenophaga sp. TaxID=1904254 RepID=UPI001D92450D|nr:hypothetical protein [Hydrogenophaga sp.]MBX3609714.1 hypothetical protein [Hydrogenophaga sp.]
MSSANDSWSFHNLSDDLAPARAAGARVFATRDRSDHIHSITVCFAGTKPSLDAVDRVLRECAAHVAAQDSSFDVFIRAEWVPHADAHRREIELIYPYGQDFFLCFDARLRQIGVRQRGGKRFVKPWPVDDVAAVCRKAYAAHDPLPLEDYPDTDDDDDSSMGDLRSEVVHWIWYGYHALSDIDAVIVARAEDDEDIDLDEMRAFAATILARKRAAEATWAAETDNDRLADAFSDLIHDGIMAVQWAGDTLDEGFDVVNSRIEAEDPRGEQYTGACFFHSQDMDRALNEEGLMVAFGHLHSDEPADYVAIGQRVCEALRRHGLRPEWNGTDRQRIGLPGFRWQRRTPD